MQLERVWSVAMGCVPLKIFRQVNDVDGLKGALLDTDTTAYVYKRGESSERRRVAVNRQSELYY